MITLLNLASGVFALLLATQNQLEYASYFIVLGIVFDFFDGFIARIINAQSELGVQLDSLADMVTSGVAPGIVMFQLLRNSDSDWSMLEYLNHFKEINWLPFLGIIVTLAAAYRLATFNIDDEQTHDFKGLPTPAFTLFIISLPIISLYGQHDWVKEIINNRLFLIATIVLGSILMNSRISLFSLKFKTFSIQDNGIKYLFLLLAIFLIIWLQVTAIPFVIILYIAISIMQNTFKTSHI